MDSSDFVYLPQKTDPSPWGVDVLGAGIAEVSPEQSYPLPGHPSEYQFDWNRGRTLSSFQALYITRGAGEFESEDISLHSFNAPSLFIVFPNHWHRYRPQIEHGWQEHWIGFDGSLPRQLLEAGTLKPENPFFEVGNHTGIFDQFQLVLDEARNEALGFREIAASAILQILALATALPSRRLEETNPMRNTVRQACFLLRDRIDRTLSVEDLASELNVGYTYFRRMFKRYTGFSPKQYHSQLRFERVKRLLQETQLPISEIAAIMAFDSPFHLSEWFKRRAGSPPSIWRSASQ